MPNLGTELRCQSTSVRQSNIFQDDKTFEEIIRKEPWTLRNYRSSWTSILHLTTPRTYESRTPCISSFPIRTLDSEHDPEPNTTPPPSVEVDDDIEYEIAEILDSKLDQRHKCKLLYLIRWAGYEGTDQEMDWLVATELTDASELVADFHSAHPSRPGPLGSLGIQV